MRPRATSLTSRTVTFSLRKSQTYDSEVCTNRQGPVPMGVGLETALVFVLITHAHCACPSPDGVCSERCRDACLRSMTAN